MIEPVLRKYLIRSYYFAEAMAVYQLYYEPLVSSYAPARTYLTDQGRREDRPPTWVPLVFHCTTAEDFKKIVESGKIAPGKKGAVSFTEIPIGELDRMKLRHRDADQIAIGFPRRLLESYGLTPVLYLKHNKHLQQACEALKKADRKAFEGLAPFVDKEDDVSALLEVRSTKSIPLEHAVWILTTTREEGRPHVPEIEKFKERYGQISQSYWHRSHQLGILSEWQFVSVKKDQDGQLSGFRFIGEHYWRQCVTKEKAVEVTLPVHEKELLFQATDNDLLAQYQGPWRFFDVALCLFRLLIEDENPESVLPHRLIRDISAEDRVS